MSFDDAAEAKELSLVGKVELRIALADSDEKLQALLTTYLCPLLLKLASPFKSVREKVVSVCQHVNTRIKSNTIKLPISGLLNQFKQNSSSLLRHFDLLYVQKGLPLLPAAERLELIPLVINGLAQNYSESSPNAAVLFNVFLRLLGDTPFPTRASKADLALRAKWGLDNSPSDAHFLAEWLGKLMLFGASETGKNGPGLSTKDWGFLTLDGKDNAWDPSNGGLRLAETKFMAARLLASGAFTDSERFLPGLFASTDTQNRVIEIGEDILKRSSASISLEETTLIEKLYSLYRGASIDFERPPVRVPLRIKILGLLSKSELATEYPENIIKMVQESLDLQDSEFGATSAAKKGLEASRLRSQVFAFINWVARMAKESSLKEIAPRLTGDLRSYIEEQGWPKANSEHNGKRSQEITSRNYGYETIGLLAKSYPDKLLIEPNLDLLHWLFRSLISDNSSAETAMSIEDALSSVLAVLSRSDLGHIEDQLISLFSHFMRFTVGDDDSGVQVSRSARYVAVRFGNRCLPFSNQHARWLDALALSSGHIERHEIIEEGKQGLDPYYFRNLNPSNMAAKSTDEAEAFASTRYRMPEPFKLIHFFFTEHSGDMDKLGAAFSTSALFCRNILFHQALQDKSKAPDIDSEWQRRLDVTISNDRASRQSITQYIQKNQSDFARTTVSNFVASILYAITSGLGESAISGKVLLELCALGPYAITEKVAKDLNLLLPALDSSVPEIRLVTAHVIGIVVSSPAVNTKDRDNYVTKLLSKLQSWESAIGSSVHQTQGAIACLGFIFSRHRKGEEMSNKLQEAKHETLLLYLTILFDSRDKDLIAAVLLAFDQLCIFSVLELDMLPSKFTAESIVEKLEEIARTGNEDAVSCLGHFAMLCPMELIDGSLLSKIRDALFGLHDIRQPELHFEVGAALACLSCSWASDSLSSVFDADTYFTPDSNNEKVLSLVLQQTLEKCKQTKPALRQASVIWLLCLVQYCGHLSEVQERLRVIQKSFMTHLADRDSLNQETASRGLSLVYEKGDQGVKYDLVHDLVGSFTSTNSNLAGTVSEETELFEPGALPTGDGSVTTYKDIVNLAREVGDPTLVYRFMSLASNSAIWSSRAAFGRFGLSKILSDSSIDGYLSKNTKIYSVLFRYRFDPNSNVRTSMNDIWLALVKDPKSVISSNFDQIMEDLLKNILGKEWRTRQASCGAVADLLQGQPLSKYEKYLTRIWTMTFKVCDDIKESVRRTALDLARVLTAILLRSLEAGDSSSSTTDAMLKQIIPFLTSSSGLESSADEVRGFALRTILEIVKKADNRALGPYLGQLVGNNLLPSLSSVEPETINYLHLNADKYGLTEQQIDDARLSSVKMSPMMEAIERCLDLLDETSMKDLNFYLSQAIKSVIGLPSSVGISRVLVSLSTRHNILFRPYAAPFLKLIRKQLLDRNDTISASAAAAGGYICRIVEQEAILSYIDSAQKLYFSAEDDRHRTISAEIFSSVLKYAPDRARELASSIVPFVYFGMHDTYESVKELFKSAWDELGGGSRTILLYIQEIVDLSIASLDSAKWTLKHTSAFAIADLVKPLGGAVSEAHTRVVWPALEKALQGKTWEGKEIVLDSFTQFIASSSTAKVDKSIANQAKKIMIREAKRNNRGIYRQHAMKCLGEFSNAFDLEDWFDDVSVIVESVFESLEDDQDEMDIDSKESTGASAKMIVEQTRGNSIRTLLQCVNPRLCSASKLDASLTECLRITQKAVKHKDTATQVAIFEGEQSLFEKISKLQDVTISQEAILGFFNTLDNQELGTENTRIKAAEAARSIAIVGRHYDTTYQQIVESVKGWIHMDRSQSVRQILQQINPNVAG